MAEEERCADVRETVRRLNVRSVPVGGLYSSSSSENRRSGRSPGLPPWPPNRLSIDTVYQHGHESSKTHTSSPLAQSAPSFSSSSSQHHSTAQSAATTDEKEKHDEEEEDAEEDAEKEDRCEKSETSIEEGDSIEFVTPDQLAAQYDDRLDRPAGAEHGASASTASAPPRNRGMSVTFARHVQEQQELVQQNEEKEKHEREEKEKEQEEKDKEQAQDADPMLSKSAPGHLGSSPSSTTLLVPPPPPQGGTAVRRHTSGNTALPSEGADGEDPSVPAGSRNKKGKSVSDQPEEARQALSISSPIMEPDSGSSSGGGNIRNQLMSSIRTRGTLLNPTTDQRAAAARASYGLQVKRLAERMKMVGRFEEVAVEWVRIFSQSDNSQLKFYANLFLGCMSVFEPCIVDVFEAFSACPRKPGATEHSSVPEVFCPRCRPGAACVDVGVWYYWLIYVEAKRNLEMLDPDLAVESEDVMVTDAKMENKKSLPKPGQQETDVRLRYFRFLQMLDTLKATEFGWVYLGHTRFVSVMKALQASLSELKKGKRTIKDKRARFKKLLQISNDFNELGLPFPSPLHPSEVTLLSINIDESRIFKSEENPMDGIIMAIAFNVFPPRDPRDPPYTILFKSGDDMRRDQNVLNMMCMIQDTVHELSRAAGAVDDLCLTTYTTIATDTRSGLMEFIINAKTLQDVFAMKIDNFLRMHKGIEIPGETEESLMKIARENLVKSFAGYSVVSYILGFGDRHLENILMICSPWNRKTHGRLVHIDFNRILDSEPKGKPHVEMRLPRDLMEFLAQDELMLFYKYCTQIFMDMMKLQPAIHALVEYLLSIAVLPTHKKVLEAITRMNLKKFRKEEIPLSGPETRTKVLNHIMDVIGQSSDGLKLKIVDIIHKMKS